MFARNGGLCIGGSGWRAGPCTTKGTNGSGGRRGRNGPCDAGASDHVLLEGKRKLLRVEYPHHVWEIGHLVPPNQGWEDPQVPQRDG